MRGVGRKLSPASVSPKSGSLFSSHMPCVLRAHSVGALETMEKEFNEEFPPSKNSKIYKFTVYIIKNKWKKAQISTGEERQSWELINYIIWNCQYSTFSDLHKWQFYMYQIAKKPSKSSQGHQEPPFEMSHAFWRISISWILSFLLIFHFLKYFQNEKGLERLSHWSRYTEIEKQ